MKPNMKKIYVLAVALTVSASGAYAQDALKSGYFMDSYNYRHQMNPAFASTRSYFSIPAIGNFNIATQSNMGISTFLYPVNGQLTTFMNKNVSADEFLGDLKNNNKFRLGTSIPVFTVGAWGKLGGFTTVELNAKINASVNMPYDLFSFMKNAGAKQHYDIKGIGARGAGYLELAIGHAHKITDNLNIGAKVKLLAGAANVKADIDKMSIDLTEEMWSVNASGSAKYSIPAMHIPTKGETGTAENISDRDLLDFDNISFDSDDIVKSIFSGIGYGLAFDLGATYSFNSGILQGLNLSAAVLDLGFISWGKMNTAVTDSKPWTFDGFDDLSLESGKDNSLENQMDALGDDFANLVRLKKGDSEKGGIDMLACTVNIGAEYEMPFYRRLSFGILSTTRIYGNHSSSEGHFAVNIEPVDWFGFTTNYGISTFGSSWGALLNFSFPGFGLFIGADSIPLNYTPGIEGIGIGVPYKKMNLNLNFGLNFNLSRVRHLGDRTR